MSERTLKQLVGALVVALVVWGVASLLSGGSGSIAASGEAAGIFDGVDAETFERLRRTRGDTTLTLERAGGGWTVNGFPADSASVQRLLEELPGMRVGELVAANPANHPRMGVSADSAVAVELEAGGEARSFLVGDAGRRFGTAYLRLPEADEVYLLEGDLRNHVRRGLEQWRNRTMLVLDTASVARIEIDRGSDGYALVRGDSAWAFEDGAEVRSSTLDGLLSELARLVASGFVAESDSIAGLGQASSTRAYDDAGTLLAEVTVSEGEGDRWARSTRDDYLYRVSTFRANRVAPSRETMEPETQP